MNSPYIKLSQSKIDPMLLESILEYVWDELSDKTKENVINELNYHNVDYDI